MTVALPRLSRTTAAAVTAFLTTLALTGCISVGPGPIGPGNSAGMVSGHVTNTAGEPIANAVVFADNTQFYDANVTAITNADGYYEIHLDDTMLGSWRVGGYVNRTFGGEELKLSLHPNQQGHFQASETVVRDLEWRISGSTIEGGHYGGDVWVHADISGEYIDTGLVEVTFTPVGPLIDGSVRDSLTKTPRVRLILDVPLGTYEVTARYKDGRNSPLLVRKRDTGTYSQSAKVSFELSQFGAPQIELEIAWP